jgi:hypothetical protein
MRVKPDSLLTDQIADHRERRDAHHDAAADPVHSITSYSNATPSGSFSSSHVSAASTFANTLMWSTSPTCFARIHVNEHGHLTIL